VSSGSHGVRVAVDVDHAGRRIDLLHDGGVTTPAVAYTATCSERTLPVAGPTEPAVISGQLCTPSGTTPTSVQLVAAEASTYKDVDGVMLTGKRVVDADEATKDQVSVPGMGTVAVFGIVLPTALGIEVPVFQAVGQKTSCSAACSRCATARARRPCARRKRRTTSRPPN
jgi:hypothetical protein